MVNIPEWFSSILAARDYRLLDGQYPTFATGQGEWDQLSEEQHEELRQEIKKHRWDIALKNVLGKHWGQYLVDYNTSPSRAVFIDKLLPKGPRLTVLDIGAGMGNISQALARRYGQVVAVDVADNVIRWLQALKKAEALDNLEVLGIDNLDNSRLPFKDGSFDLVVLGMTLQWIGSFAQKRSPDEIQKKVLRDIYRVLKPGGRLVFFDRNRYFYGYFLGESDGSAVKYASVLPRRLADWLTWWKRTFPGAKKNYYHYISQASLGSKQYRNYKHLYSYLERVFRSIGYRRCESYIAVPSVKFQKVFIPLKETGEAEKLYGQGFLTTILPSIKGHWLAKFFIRSMIRARLARFLAEGYLMIVEK